MALFLLESEEDREGISYWTRKLYYKIHVKSHQQCERYDFDFYQGFPSEKPLRYRWQILELKEDKGKNVLDMRESVLSSTTEEQTTEFPEFFVRGSQVFK